MGANCSRNHSKEILKRLKRHKDISLSTSCCMGMCSKSPTIMVDGKLMSRVNPAKADELIGKKSQDSINGPVIPDDNGLDSTRDLLEI